MRLKEIILLCIALVLLVIGFVLSQQNNKTYIKHTTTRDTLYKYDTLRYPITTIKTKLKIIYDTTKIPIYVQPFTATLDTIDPTTLDTVSVCYTFPANDFAYYNRHRPRLEKTITIHQRDSITIEVPYQKEEWYVPYLKYGLFITAGYIIGRIQ